MVAAKADKGVKGGISRTITDSLARLLSHHAWLILAVPARPARSEGSFVSLDWSRRVSAGSRLAVVCDQVDVDGLGMSYAASIGLSHLLQGFKGWPLGKIYTQDAGQAGGPLIIPGVSSN